MTEFKVDSNFRAVVKRVDSETEDRVEAATHELRNEVNETLSGQRAGRRYPVPDSEGDEYYRASRPGFPPASATGRGRTTINWEVEKRLTEVVGRVGTPLDYMAKLESGEYPAGPDSVVKRPWLYPSFRRAKPGMLDTIGGHRWF